MLNQNYKKNDLLDGLLFYRLWIMLSWTEIKSRYRRSILGPLWITMSMGVMIGLMGPLYSTLFNRPLSSYYQNLAISYVAWIFISSTVLESCQIFIDSEGLIKQIRLPFSIYMYKCICKNIIVFLHNFMIVIIVLIFFPPITFIYLPLFIVALLIIFLNLFFLGLFLGVICARYRDVYPFVNNFLQILFFVTPIFWTADMIGSKILYLNFNPLYHFMEIIRTPLLGGSPNLFSCVYTLLVTTFLIPGCLIFFLNFKKRIIYFL